MKKSRLIVAGCLAALAAVGALWLRSGPDWLSARLRGPVEQALSKSSGRSVGIGGVGLGLSGWLWLRDVRVGPLTGVGSNPWDISFTAEAVGLKLDAWSLFKGKADLGSLKALQVEVPRVFVLDAGSVVQGSALPVSPEASARVVPPKGTALPLAASVTSTGAVSQDWPRFLAGLGLPLVPLDSARGEVWRCVRGDRPVLLAGDLSVNLEPQNGGGWKLRASGRPGEDGEVGLEATCGKDFTGLQVRASARKLAWPVWLKTPAGMGPVQGSLSGEVEVDSLAGSWPWGLDARGQGDLDGVVLRGAGKPGLTGLMARWSLKNGRVVLDRLQADYAGGRVYAQATADLPEGRFNATVTAQAADLGGMALSAGAPPDLGIKGAADLDLWAEGPFSAPALRVELRSRAARWLEHPLTGLDLRASGGGGRWNAQGTLAWDGGKGSVMVRFGQGGLEKASLAVSSLPADWLEAWAGPGMAGRLDGQGTFSRPESAWQVDLKGSGLTVRGASVERASLQASGNAHIAHLSLAADFPRLAGLKGAADAALRPDGFWVLDSAKLYQNTRLLLLARGLWKPGGKAGRDLLRLKVKSATLDLGLLSPALAREGWRGGLKGWGHVALDSGTWSGDLNASTLNLARGDWAFPGAGAVHFGPDGVTVTALDLRGGEVQGGASAPGWSGPWKADLKLAKARLAALADLPGLDRALPRGVSGWASGSLDYAEATPASFDADLKFSDPLPGLLPSATGSLDLHRQAGRWTLRSLDVSQAGGGSFHGEAGLDWGAGSRWSGQARWKDLRLKGFTSSGRARLSGGEGDPGRLTLAAWSLSTTALPALDVLFHFGGKGLSSVEGRWGPGLVWEAHPERGVWQGSLDLSGQDPGVLAGFWLGHGGATALRLDGHAEGSLGSPGRPAFARLVLREQGSPGALLKAQSQWPPNGFRYFWDFKNLKLGRLVGAARALGLSPPLLDGSASGQAKGDAASLTVTASVQKFFWNKKNLGPATVTGGWGGAGAWVQSAAVGAEAGPRLELDKADWRRIGAPSGGAWAASGRIRVVGWPLALWPVSADALFRLSGGRDVTVWKAHCASLQLGMRSWPNMGFSGTWVQGASRYTLKESSSRPTLVASGSLSGGGFSLDDLRARSGRGRGRLRGSVGKNGALDFEGSSDGLPASDLAEMMGWPQDWTGSAWGTLKVSGTIGHAHTVVSAKVEDGSVQGLPFDLSTGYVVQDGDWVYLSSADPIRVSRRDGTLLEVGGRVPLEDNPPPGQGMDVWAALRQGGLDLFSGLPAITSASGPLLLKMKFTGSTVDPRVDGVLSVSNGRVVPAWLLPGLERVGVLAQIRDSKVTLQKAEATVGEDGPLLKVEAADPLRPAFVFKDWTPADMNLRIRSSRSGLPAQSTRALTFIQGTLHPDLVLSGDWDHPALGGSLSLDRGGADKAVVQWPPEFQDTGASSGGSWFDHMDYHLSLKARSDVMVRTGAAEVFVDTGDAGVMIQGAGGSRSLTGQIRLVQGSLDYLLATFQLARDHDNWVRMAGDAPAEVELWGVDDIGSVTLAGEEAPRDVQVLLHAWGPLGSVQMRLSEEDDPSLTQDQLATMLGMGSDSGDPRAQAGFTRMLGEVPANWIKSWGRRTGILDEVGFSSPALDEAAAPTPGVGDSGQVGATGQELMAQPTPVTGTASAKSLLEVSMGKYVGSKLFVGVDTEVMQRTDPLGRSSVDPEVGGVVEYQLPDNSKLSVQHAVDTDGQIDNRVMLESSDHFDNYDPKRRRWDGTPTPIPSPLPAVTPTPTPTVTSTAVPGPIY